jgi:hypothetical protein
VLMYPNAGSCSISLTVQAISNGKSSERRISSGDRSERRVKPGKDIHSLNN